MSVTLDILDGGITVNASGVEATRVAIVQGLSGSGAARQYSALSVSGMPQRGAAHPAIPGIVLDEIRIQAERDTDSVRATLVYRALDASEIAGGEATIEVASAVVTEQTSRDKDGRQITITHEREDVDDDGNVVDTTSETQVVTVEKMVPQMTYRVRRKEETNPERNARLFVGRVGDFAHAPGFFPEWLCLGITGSTDDGGQSWDVTYEFVFRPEGWRVLVEPIDTNTGQPVVGGAGKLIPIYQEISFGPLGLPSPSSIGSLAEQQAREQATR